MYNNIDNYEELILFMYISDSDYDKIRNSHQLVQTFHNDKSWNTFKEIIIKYINDEKILELLNHL
jgi:hypothetical protein